MRVSRPGKSRGQSVIEFALVLPLMLALLMTIFDLGRIYATMLAVESAAREAADYGAYTAERWDDPGETVNEMKTRACVATWNLTDYVGDATRDPEGKVYCTNPEFAYVLVEKNPDCKNGTLEPPCEVTVTLRYQFKLIVPFGFDIGGTRYGFPETITFERTSTYRVSNLGPSPTPGTP